MGEDYNLAHTVYELEPNEFIDRIPVYDTYGPNWDRLDQARMITEAFNYAPYTLCYPFGPTSGLTFGALATKEGSLQIAAGAFLIGISGFSSVSSIATASPTDNGAGFRFSVTDKGSGVGVAERSFIFDRLLAGVGRTPNPELNDAFVSPYSKMGAFPYWLDAPMLITKPGQVQVAITNLAGASAFIQLALHFAYPINNSSVNTPQIKPA